MRISVYSNTGKVVYLSGYRSSVKIILSILVIKFIAHKLLSLFLNFAINSVFRIRIVLKQLKAIVARLLHQCNLSRTFFLSLSCINIRYFNIICVCLKDHNTLCIIKCDWSNIQFFSSFIFLYTHFSKRCLDSDTWLFTYFPPFY